MADGRLVPGDTAAEADAAKPLRLLIKKRLLASDDDIAAIADIAYRKRVLENEFAQAAAQYAAAAHKCRLLSGGGGDATATARVAELAAAASASQAAMDAESEGEGEGT